MLSIDDLELGYQILACFNQLFVRGQRHAALKGALGTFIGTIASGDGIAT